MALLFVVGVFLWTVHSAGGFEPNPGGDYYNLLVEGYERGHTWMNVTPHPEMLRLADPYDPAQNNAYRVPDGSYFKGKYYLYFGPTPAVALLLPYRLLTGAHLPTGAGVFVFVTVGFLAASAVWLGTRHRWFPASHGLTAPCGVLVIGLCSHLLALARRPMFWEISIAAGFAFAMLAVWFATRACTSKWPRLAMLSAGLCLGFAFASRPPYLFATILVVPAALWAWFNRRGWAEAARWIVIPAMAFTICLVGVLVYNYARFEDALEFGQNYQLTSVYERKMKHFGLGYIPHNLFIYYVCPVNWTWEFPWVSLRPAVQGPPGYYGGEEVGGALFTFPILVLASGAFLSLSKAARTSRAGAAVAVGSVACLFVPLAVFLLAFFSATERYMADFCPALAMLAAFGWLEIESRLAGRLRLAVISAFVGLATLSCFVGLLVSVDYHGRLLRLQSPSAWAVLQSATEPVVAKLRFWAGLEVGRTEAKLRFGTPSSGTIESLRSVFGPGSADEHEIVVRYEEGAVRLGISTQRRATRWSRALAVKSDRAYRVSVQYPASATERTMLYGVSALGFHSVALWFEGERVLSFLPTPSVSKSKERGIRQFSGDVVSTIARSRDRSPAPPSDERRWRLVTSVPSSFTDAIKLVTCGDGAATGFWLEQARQGELQVVYRQGNEVRSRTPTFPATDQIVVEIAHPPVWPWSAVEGERCRFDIAVNGRSLGTCELQMNGVLPEQVSLNSQVEISPSRRADRGGVLRVRVWIPREVPAQADPVLVVGKRGAGDMIGFKRQSADTARFVFDHWGAPLVESPIVRLEPERVHVIDINMPSLLQKTFGQASAGELVVHLNGEEVLRATGPFAPFLEQGFDVGKNPLGGTTFGLSVDGAIVDWAWVKPPGS
jgi:hypothetical protein